MKVYGTNTIFSTRIRITANGQSLKVYPNQTISLYPGDILYSQVKPVTVNSSSDGKIFLVGALTLKNTGQVAEFELPIGSWRLETANQSIGISKTSIKQPATGGTKNDSGMNFYTTPMTGLQNDIGMNLQSISIGEIDPTKGIEVIPFPAKDAVDQLVKGQVGITRLPLYTLVVKKPFASNGVNYVAGQKTTSQDANFSVDVANDVLLLKQAPGVMTFAGIPPQKLSDYFTVSLPDGTVVKPVEPAGEGTKKSSTVSLANQPGYLTHAMFMVLWAGYGFWVYKGWPTGCKACRAAMVISGGALAYLSYSTYKQQ